MKRNRGSASEDKTQQQDKGRTTGQTEGATDQERSDIQATMKRESVDRDTPVPVKRQKSDEEEEESARDRALGSATRPALEERLLGYELAIEEMQGSLQREPSGGSPRDSSTGDQRSDNDAGAIPAEGKRRSVDLARRTTGEHREDLEGSIGHHSITEERRRRRREKRRRRDSYSSGSLQTEPSLFDYIADLENIAKDIERQSPP